MDASKQPAKNLRLVMFAISALGLASYMPSEFMALFDLSTASLSMPFAALLLLIIMQGIGALLFVIELKNTMASRRSSTNTILGATVILLIANRLYLAYSTKIDASWKISTEEFELYGIVILSWIISLMPVGGAENETKA